MKNWVTPVSPQGANPQRLPAKHLCEISAELVANIAPVTARLVDWFLAEVAA